MLETRTDIHPFCILRTPFDTSFNALCNYGYHPKRPLQKTHVLQICSYLGPQEVPSHDFECIQYEISQLKQEDASQGLYTPQQTKNETN